MAEASGNAGSQRIATAMLVYGPDDAAPDLAVIVQFLLDDLRAEGWRVTRLWMGERGAHIVFDGHDLILAPIDAAATAARLGGAMRPAAAPGAIRPDPLRARLVRWLQTSVRGLTVTLRRGPGIPGPASTLQLAQMARLCLLPAIEAAPPRAVLWQPRALLLTPDEVSNRGPDVLLMPADADTAIGTTTGRPNARPKDRLRPVHPRAIRPRPHTRAQRAARASAGRLFGSPGQRNTTPLPRPDRALARLSAALRSEDPFSLPHPAPARPARAYAVTVQWIVLVPYLLAAWLPYA